MAENGYHFDSRLSRLSLFGGGCKKPDLKTKGWVMKTMPGALGVALAVIVVVGIVVAAMV